MQYWQFRLTVYQRHLEAWLNTIKQAAAGVVYLFPMAMPALLMLPLLALGVMADSATSTQQYCLALWGFLLLTHSWVILQKDGILATPYEHYHNGLPLSTVQRKVTTALLTVYASHVFVAGPILLFFIMAIGNIDLMLTEPVSMSLHQLFPIAAACLLSVQVIRLALFSRYPTIGLIMGPLVALPLLGDVAKPLVIIVWSGVLFAEQKIPAFRLGLPLLLKGLLRFFLQADIAQANKVMLRLISLLILLICAQVFMQAVNPHAAIAAGYLFSFIVAVLLGSKLLDTLQVKAQHQFYLDSLPVTRSTQSTLAVIYSTIYCIPLLALVLWFDSFNLSHWVLLLALLVVTKVGILLSQKYFLTIPCCAAMVAWWVF